MISQMTVWLSCSFVVPLVVPTDCKVRCWSPGISHMTVWLSCSIAVPLVVSTDNLCQITVSRDFSDDSMGVLK